MLGSSLSSLSDEASGRLRDLMSDVRCELLPLPGALEAARHLGAGSQVAVTADPERDMKATIDLCVALAEQGFEVLPHLSAQLTSDRAELESYLARVSAAGIGKALVVGGVAEPPGEYFDAADLLDAIDEIGSPFSEIGIGGYPEGHHQLDDQLIDGSLLEKAERADWITTQICFSTRRLRNWVERVRADGVDLPIWLGIPAVADLTGLMSLGMRVGAGRSLQFMFEHPRLVTRLLRPGGRQATELVVRLAELAADDALGIAGFHLFTYNQVKAAERWRRRIVRKVS